MLGFYSGLGSLVPSLAHYRIEGAGRDRIRPLYVMRTLNTVLSDGASERTRPS